MALMTAAEISPILWTTGYKYRLARDFQAMLPIKGIFARSKSGLITLHESGLLVIKRGWAWDGASGLTIDTKSSMRGALIHDALYQLIREGLLPLEYREIADRILKAVCQIDGMWKWRARLWLRAVRNFGLYAAVKARKIYVFPKKRGEKMWQT